MRFRPRRDGLLVPEAAEPASDVGLDVVVDGEPPEQPVPGR